MEADFLRQEAARRSIDLGVAATSASDYAFASDFQHDAIIVGALRSRRFIFASRDSDREPHAHYITEARSILRHLRERTNAPILIDNLPEPTVQPLGLAEKGRSGHRSRFRMANLALAGLADEIVDLYIVDIAAALSGFGSARCLDDGYVDFVHMGAPGWLLQRPESERAAVHNMCPDLSPIIELVNGDPYCREGIACRAHLDVLITVLGFGRKKCVIVDLDGTLWPGVLAETGTPFAWKTGVSSIYSYVGLYFGLHEALLCLKKRGILLACVSKNDETTIRELWKYPAGYPTTRLVTIEDFVTHRINWDDKADNIDSIARELGYPLEAFLFIDDNPVERERVKQKLPQVDTWGEDLVSLRRALLTDPRLQVTHITDESLVRTGLVKSQLERMRRREEAEDEDAFLESLEIQISIERQTTSGNLDRIEELFRRTTQFNTTGRFFSIADLQTLIRKQGGILFSICVSDHFGDHGLVGAAAIDDGEVLNLVLSCRVLGLGVEHRFLQHIISEIGPDSNVRGIIRETSRNIPARNLYRDNGFCLNNEGHWHLGLQI